MAQPNDLSRSLTPFLQGNTLVVVIELSLTSWLVGGLVPGLERQPLKKLEPDETGLLRLLRRWKEEAVKSGCNDSDAGLESAHGTGWEADDRAR